MSLVRIEFSRPESDCDACQAYLSLAVPHGWEETRGPDGAVFFRFFLDGHPLWREIAAEIEKRWPGCGCSCTEEEACDWSASWREFFVPIECGDRFEVLPPWLAGDGRADLTPILIEPKMAFGTGHHPSTALCLAAIASLHRRGLIRPGQEFLDLGTGSGILGIALCKLGLSGIGLDTDPQAVACARENVALNDAAGMRLAVGSLASLKSGRPLDVIVANILSGPLVGMAREMTARLAPGGCLVLSGILAEQADAVERAYAEAGLPGAARLSEGEWVALVWPASGAA
jgi:ribosomal protein L11 methyltransferase